MKNPIPPTLRNALLNSGSWGVIVVINILLIPFYISKLHLEGFGIYSLLTSLVGYYSLLDLGLGQGVVKFVSQYTAVADVRALKNSINAALWTQLILGSAGSLLLVVFAEPLLRLLNVSESSRAEATSALYWCSLGLFLTMISATLTAVITGLQRYDITSMVNVSSNVLLNAGLVIMFAMGGGLQGALAVNVIVALGVLLTNALLMRKFLPQWRFGFPEELSHVRVLFGFSGYTFLARFPSVFNTYVTRFLISMIVGPAAVTLYVVPMRIVTALNGFLGSATTVLFPLASQIHAVNDKEKLRSVFLRSFRYAVMAAIPAFLLVGLIAKPGLTIWMGDEFARQAWPILAFLSAAYFLSFMSTVPANMALGMGHSKILAQYSIIVILIGVLSVYSLTKQFGILGTSSAVLLTQITVFFFVRHVSVNVFRVSVRDLLKTVGWLHVGAIPFFACGTILVSQNGLLGSLPGLAVFSLLFLTLYYSAGVFFGLLPNEIVLQIRSKVQELFRSRL